MRDEPGVTGGGCRWSIVQAGDTLRWRDADGPEAERRDFILSPAGEDEFSRARRAADGQYWPDAGMIVSFTMEKGRATGFEVRDGERQHGARATRVR